MDFRALGVAWREFRDLGEASELLEFLGWVQSSWRGLYDGGD
jgi:hypothetical protein